MSPAGVELLKAQAGWNVILSNKDQYAEHLATCDALIVRSAVRVTPDLLKKAPRLRVIGRAGVGVDNVDLPAATHRGVLVMNTPGGNAVAVAEQTLGFMLGMARYIPQACALTKSGVWDKKSFLGTELREKTLGIIGLGAIGREVALRARGFGMRIVAHDPYVSPASAADINIELVSLDELSKRGVVVCLCAGDESTVFLGLFDAGLLGVRRRDFPCIHAFGLGDWHRRRGARAGGLGLLQLGLVGGTDRGHAHLR